MSDCENTPLYSSSLTQLQDRPNLSAMNTGTLETREPNNGSNQEQTAYSTKKVSALPVEGQYSGKIHCLYYAKGLVSFGVNEKSEMASFCRGRVFIDGIRVGRQFKLHDILSIDMPVTLDVQSYEGRTICYKATAIYVKGQQNISQRKHIKSVEKVEETCEKKPCPEETSLKPYTTTDVQCSLESEEEIYAGSSEQVCGTSIQPELSAVRNDIETCSETVNDNRLVDEALSKKLFLEDQIYVEDTAFMEYINLISHKNIIDTDLKEDTALLKQHTYNKNIKAHYSLKLGDIILPANKMMCGKKVVELNEKQCYTRDVSEKCPKSDVSEDVRKTDSQLKPCNEFKCEETNKTEKMLNYPLDLQNTKQQHLKHILLPEYAYNVSGVVDLFLSDSAAIIEAKIGGQNVKILLYKKNLYIDGEKCTDMKGQLVEGSTHIFADVFKKEHDSGASYFADCAWVGRRSTKSINLRNNKKSDEHSSNHCGSESRYKAAHINKKVICGSSKSNKQGIRKESGIRTQVSCLENKVSKDKIMAKTVKDNIDSQNSYTSKSDADIPIETEKLLQNEKFMNGIIEHFSSVDGSGIVRFQLQNKTEKATFLRKNILKNGSKMTDIQVTEEIYIGMPVAVFRVTTSFNRDTSFSASINISCSATTEKTYLRAASSKTSVVKSDTNKKITREEEFKTCKFNISQRHMFYKERQSYCWDKKTEQDDSTSTFGNAKTENVDDEFKGPCEVSENRKLEAMDENENSRTAAVCDEQSNASVYRKDKENEQIKTSASNERESNKEDISNVCKEDGATLSPLWQVRKQTEENELEQPETPACRKEDIFQNANSENVSNELCQEGRQQLKNENEEIRNGEGEGFKSKIKRYRREVTSDQDEKQKVKLKKKKMPAQKKIKKSKNRIVRPENSSAHLIPAERKEKKFKNKNRKFKNRPKYKYSNKHLPTLCNNETQKSENENEQVETEVHSKKERFKQADLENVSSESCQATMCKTQNINSHVNSLATKDQNTFQIEKFENVSDVSVGRDECLESSTAKPLINRSEQTKAASLSEESSLSVSDHQSSKDFKALTGKNGIVKRYVSRTTGVLECSISGIKMEVEFHRNMADIEESDNTDLEKIFPVGGKIYFDGYVEGTEHLFSCPKVTVTKIWQRKNNRKRLTSKSDNVLPAVHYSEIFREYAPYLGKVSSVESSRSFVVSVEIGNTTYQVFVLNTFFAPYQYGKNLEENHSVRSYIGKGDVVHVIASKKLEKHVSYKYDWFAVEAWTEEVDAIPICKVESHLIPEELDKRISSDLEGEILTVYHKHGIIKSGNSDYIEFFRQDAYLFGISLAEFRLDEVYRSGITVNYILAKKTVSCIKRASCVWIGLHDSSPDIIDTRSRTLKIIAYIKHHHLDKEVQMNLWSALPGKGKGITFYSHWKKGNTWISNKKGLSCGQWTEAIKMSTNVIAVRSLPCRSLSNTHCRRCNEYETLSHVLGFCPQCELLRIDRHNTVRSIIANRLREHGEYEVYEEVQCLSAEGSTRCADIIIIDRDKKTGLILDSTVRFEINEDQPKQIRELGKQRKELEHKGRLKPYLLDYCGDEDDCVEIQPNDTVKEKTPAVENDCEDEVYYSDDDAICKSKSNDGEKIGCSSLEDVVNQPKDADQLVSSLRKFCESQIEEILPKTEYLSAFGNTAIASHENDVSVVSSSIKDVAVDHDVLHTLSSNIGNTSNVHGLLRIVSSSNDVIVADDHCQSAACSIANIVDNDSQVWPGINSLRNAEVVQNLEHIQERPEYEIFTDSDFKGPSMPGMSIQSIKNQVPFSQSLTKVILYKNFYLPLYLCVQDLGIPSNMFDNVICEAIADSEEKVKEVVESMQNIILQKGMELKRDEKAELSLVAGMKDSQLVKDIGERVEADSASVVPAEVESGSVMCDGGSSRKSSHKESETLFIDKPHFATAGTQYEILPENASFVDKSTQTTSTGSVMFFNLYND
ncbi:hypothetical protein ANN_05521 [Periplaneta americana]|uniref:Uncharacterized protein n=1 Tax=Periplaneta americana TaxID=6978 RepID=A0ABQ8TB32_PERAM|nr:hypothetical protein ANN_05521 [Periplaneta americana]